MTPLEFVIMVYFYSALYVIGCSIEALVWKILCINTGEIV